MKAPRGLGGFAPQGRAANGVAASQPFQWSSEYSGTDLGLVYYNYRHYNPLAGRWTEPDLKKEYKGGIRFDEIGAWGRNIEQRGVNEEP